MVRKMAENRKSDLEDDANYDKKDKTSLIYGTHETQVSEGGEANLHQCYDRCKKKSGHTQFVPVNEFTINHLPSACHDRDVVHFIKASSDLTLRVAVDMVSTKRSQFWPNTIEPYPFYDKRGSCVLRTGTGTVCGVIKWSEEDVKESCNVTCDCQKCQHSDTPSNVCGEIRMFTATHVVFDDTEAQHTNCRLFFDGEDSPQVTLEGWTVCVANTETDRCVLKCVTCDVNLLDKLDKMLNHWGELSVIVQSRYGSSRDEEKLTFIVSHPHGCPKQVSVGQWIRRKEKKEGTNWTKYTYTTCTCPGSSGAYVHPLGYDGDLISARHVHSGVTTDGENVSGFGRDHPF